jgi:hypothetical protein
MSLVSPASQYQVILGLGSKQNKTRVNRQRVLFSIYLKINPSWAKSRDIAKKRRERKVVLGTLLLNDPSLNRTGFLLQHIQIPAWSTGADHCYGSSSPSHRTPICWVKLIYWKKRGKTWGVMMTRARIKRASCCNATRKLNNRAQVRTTAMGRPSPQIKVL